MNELSPSNTYSPPLINANLTYPDKFTIEESKPPPPPAPRSSTFRPHNMAEQTLNIPQILVFLVITSLLIRWLFSKPSGSSTRLPAGQSRGFGVNPAHVDQLSQMFPQLSRRDIMWDLQRNGGNVTATTERVLSGRALEVPPPSFQPLNLRPSNPTSRTATPSSRPAHTDLITRYNLASKVNTPASDASPSESNAPKKAWSQDRDERQKLLQRRREEMILAARRKMEEKDRTKSATTS